jgi:hypothetical protein
MLSRTFNQPRRRTPAGTALQVPSQCTGAQQRCLPTDHAGRNAGWAVARLAAGKLAPGPTIIVGISNIEGPVRPKFDISIFHGVASSNVGKGASDIIFEVTGVTKCGLAGDASDGGDGGVGGVKLAYALQQAEGGWRGGAGLWSKQTFSSDALPCRQIVPTAQQHQQGGHHTARHQAECRHPCAF